MKILLYDCFSGISGDMNLGAMIDLGVPEEKLVSGLRSLGLEGWDFEITREQRHGITGTKVTVLTNGHDHHDSQKHDHDHDHGHDHHHHHGHHHHGYDHEHDTDHEHDHNHDHDHGHEHGHRNLGDIRTIIGNSSLSGKVKASAMHIFGLIAAAESEVHNMPVDQVHFHEVGAVDSIIDITGAAICLDALGVDRVFVSNIELGSGTVKCDHGILPVPAPATLRLLKGFPVHTGGVGFEATTPTGAAIISAFASAAPADMRYSVINIGYGVGQKENPSLPNMLRVYLAETEDEKTKYHDSVMVECNIDDMNPELADYIATRLFSAGVPDVCFIPVMMKKSRPSFIISIICEEEHLPAVREVLFTESTTLGIRVIPFRKETLEREVVEVETIYGTIAVKKSYFNGRLVTVKPEADRCAQLAAACGAPMKEIIRVAAEKAHKTENDNRREG